jgi:hypothetical protein
MGVLHAKPSKACTSVSPTWSAVSDSASRHSSSADRKRLLNRMRMACVELETTRGSF